MTGPWGIFGIPRRDHLISEQHFLCSPQTFVKIDFVWPLIKFPSEVSKVFTPHCHRGDTRSPHSCLNSDGSMLPPAYLHSSQTPTPSPPKAHFIHGSRTCSRQVYENQETLFHLCALQIWNHDKENVKEEISYYLSTINPIFNFPLSLLRFRSGTMADTIHPRSLVSCIDRC